MHRLKQFILLGGDLTMLFVGWLAALTLRHWEFPGNNSLPLLAPFAILFIVATIIFFIAGLYDLGQNNNSWLFFQKIIVSANIWTILGVIYFYIHPGNAATPKTILLLTTIIAFGLVTLWRYLHNRFLSSNFLTANIVFAGLTSETVELITLLEREPQRGFATIGIIHAGNPNVLRLPQAPTLTALRAGLSGSSIHLIVIAPESAKNDSLLQELYQSLFHQVELVDLANFYEQTMGRIPPFTFSEAWFLTHLREQRKKIYDRARILIDYISAAVMGLFFVVTFPLVAGAIKINSPGPVLFKQKRVGRSGRLFTIYKYRTMQSLSQDGSAELAGPQYAATNDGRITPVGKILRRSRLDEVPQFINIMRGEMGIIGPRPERPEFARTLTSKMPFYALRHLVKPGLTGWAQLHKSYYGTIDENLHKLEYDLYYVKNRGLFLDATILLKTLAVLARLAGR